jgi:hypothetical protein
MTALPVAQAYLAAHRMAHPLTGEPLRVKHLNLPPGSLVSIPAHMPHYVSPMARLFPVKWFSPLMVITKFSDLLAFQN